MENIYISLASGLYSLYNTGIIKKQGLLKISNVYTLNNVIELLFKERETTTTLEKVYKFSEDILENENKIKRIVKRELKKIKNKNITILEVKEIKFDEHNKYKEILSDNFFPIIYIEEELLPPFIYILYDLHIKILRKILLLLLSIKNYREIVIPEKINLDYAIIGFKAGLEPLFALSLYYNSKYLKNKEFYLKYANFINNLAIEVNRNIVNIVEEKRVDDEILMEFSNDIKKLRNESIL